MQRSPHTHLAVFVAADGVEAVAALDVLLLYQRALVLQRLTGLFLRMEEKAALRVESARRRDAASKSQLR
jgi:hypothetical protein